MDVIGDWHSALNVKSIGLRPARPGVRNARVDGDPVGGAWVDPSGESVEVRRQLVQAPDFLGCVGVDEGFVMRDPVAKLVNAFDAVLEWLTRLGLRVVGHPVAAKNSQMVTSWFEPPELVLFRQSRAHSGGEGPRGPRRRPRCWEQGRDRRLPHGSWGWCTVR